MWTPYIVRVLLLFNIECLYLKADFAVLKGFLLGLSSQMYVGANCFEGNLMNYVSEVFTLVFQVNLSFKFTKSIT